MGRGLDEQAARETLDEAVELGITLLDTAYGYALGASEAMIGRWLADRSSQQREEIRLSTKIAPPQRAEAVRPFDHAFLEERFSDSLERLGVDAVELLFTHAPDDATPVEVTLEGLEAIRESGRCRGLGASNVDPAELSNALDAAERLGLVGYEVVQNSYSLLSPGDDEVVRSICAERGLGYTAFSPLAGGVLTGKYRRDVPPPPDTRMALRPEGFDEKLTPAAYGAIDRLRAIAEDRHRVECGALALAWLLHCGDVAAVVTGPARRSPHLGLAAQALQLQLSDSELAEIESWFRRSQ